MISRSRVASSKGSSRVLAATVAAMLLMPNLAVGQATKKAPLREIPVVRQVRTESAAWSLPDVNDLVERVYRRIVNQDKPGALPIAQYTQRTFGRDETQNAVRRFTGRDVELAPSAFSPMMGWPSAHGLETPAPCAIDAAQCAPSPNSVWIAITRFERGEASNELYVWYTTRFSARVADQPVASAYAFCERWFRVAGVWKYEGFIRVTSA